jgi:hypothetical protein
MSLSPLSPLPLLALLYWEAPRIVPYATKIARGGILCTAALILPEMIYASLYGWPTSAEDSVLTGNRHGTSSIVFATLADAGMFFGFGIAAVCCFIDAKRRPPK